MPKNIKLLQDTLAFIQANPDKHSQGDWVDPATEACETTMCFAGHAAILAGGTFDRDIFGELWEWNVDQETGQHVRAEDDWDDGLPDGVVHVADFAQRKLGLTRDERAYLFAGNRSRGEIEEAVEKFSEGKSIEWNDDLAEWVWV